MLEMDEDKCKLNKKITNLKGDKDSLKKEVRDLKIAIEDLRAKNIFNGPKETLKLFAIIGMLCIIFGMYFT